MESRYKSREILKSYFRKGCVPTEEQFVQWIDSVPNLEDDGQVTVTAADGIRLFPTGVSGTAATFFAKNPEQDGGSPLWRLTLGMDGSLEICNGGGEPVMTIDKEKNVVVSGTFKAAKYLSGKDKEEVLSKRDTLKINADGLWYSLPAESAVGRSPEGCRVYRISACYKNLRSGEYSVCEVLASHSRGRRRKVHSSCRHWWGWSGHIKVRWLNLGGKLYLQMKRRGVSSGSESILCRLETVWEV